MSRSGAERWVGYWPSRPATKTADEIKQAQEDNICDWLNNSRSSASSLTFLFPQPLSLSGQQKDGCEVDQLASKAVGGDA
jgi:hypothetical protein